MIDITGQSFGRLTVVRRVENDADGRTMWLCRCSCGSEKIVSGKLLRNGHVKSCGCLAKQNSTVINRTGERFGKLTVISRAEDYISPSGKRHVMWNCLCDCGKQTTVDACQLTTGHTKSCGCLHREKLSKGVVKHGGRKDRLYHVYSNMKNRCYNKNASDYKYYGQRGISICDEWKNNYQSFKEWAVNNGYEPNSPRGECTIDRIDVNGNYEPANCRWVTMAVQSKNRRNVINKE